jgi:DNA-directed RNA polymerase specialized sigma24 family protein
VAWDTFVGRYRRLLFATIRQRAVDHDDVMDIFAYVCEALREDDYRRLRAWKPDAVVRARFSTWLVTVVQRLMIDWFRRRDGRRRAPAFVDGMNPRHRAIFELVFIERMSHLEAYGIICARNPPGPSYNQFLEFLRETYRTAAKGRFAALGTAPQVPDVPEPAPAAEISERVEWLDRALRSIPPVDRVALELTVVENLPAGDIARILGLPNAKAVYNRVYRAQAALRAWFAAAGIGGRSDV